MALRTHLPPPAREASSLAPAQAPTAPAVRPAPEGRAPAALPVEALEALLQAVREAPRGRARSQALARWREALCVLPPEGPQRRARADFLLGALASGTLQALRDGQGRTARAEAAEGLLALGYPYALEMAPEDLAHLRAVGPGGALRARLAAGALLSSSGLGLWALEPPSLVGALGVGLVGLLGGAGLQAALSGEEGARRRAGLLALLSLGMAGAGGVLDPGLWLAGLGPLVAALLVSRRP